MRHLQELVFGAHFSTVFCALCSFLARARKLHVCVFYKSAEIAFMRFLHRLNIFRSSCVHFFRCYMFQARGNCIHAFFTEARKLHLCVFYKSADILKMRSARVMHFSTIFRTLCPFLHERGNCIYAFFTKPRKSHLCVFYTRAWWSAGCRPAGGQMAPSWLAGPGWHCVSGAYARLVSTIQPGNKACPTKLYPAIPN